MFFGVKHFSRKGLHPVLAFGSPTTKHTQSFDPNTFFTDENTQAGKKQLQIVQVSSSTNQPIKFPHKLFNIQTRPSTAPPPTRNGLHCQTGKVTKPVVLLLQLVGHKVHESCLFLAGDHPKEGKTPVEKGGTKTKHQNNKNTTIQHGFMTP